MKTPFRPSSLLALGLGLLLLAGCGQAAVSQAAGQRPIARGMLAKGQRPPAAQDPIGQFPKSEGSGVAASRQYPGVYWAQRDSGLLGGRTELYAFQVAHGRLAEWAPGVYFKTFEVPGTVNTDWEDLAADDEGHLWVGDIGNNGHNRTDLRLYQLEEPDPYTDTQATLVATHPVRYPDAPQVGGSFNAESLFVVEGVPYILTKDASPAFYALTPPGAPGAAATLTRICGLTQPAGGLDGLPTAAAISSDGARLAVTTNGQRVWVYATVNEDLPGPSLVADLASRPPRFSAPYTPDGSRQQVEAVAFNESGYDLVLLSESKRLMYFPVWFYEGR